MKYVPVVVIGWVVDSTDGTVGFDEGVLSLYNVAIASFPLALLVTGVAVGDSVVELVAGVGLQRIQRVWKSPAKKQQLVYEFDDIFYTSICFNIS